MAQGIFVYAEQFNQQAEPQTAELISAAKGLGLSEPITAIAFGEEKLAQQLQWDGVSSLIVSCAGVSEFQEDAVAAVIAKIIREKAPKYIIIPATGTAKSLFSRIAVFLNVGLTADCTEILMEDGKLVQKKPAFGNAMVITEETDMPAMVTVVTGIYPPCPAGASAGSEVITAKAPASKIQAMEVLEQEVESIVDAETLLSLGRGVRDGGAIDTARELVGKLGAAIGGTRPLVDDGTIPFEQQIGQTGCTVHPKICLFFGVSGAIQHTEGVRDTKLTIAVNTNEQAGIFSFADYGAMADAAEVMRALADKL